MQIGSFLSCWKCLFLLWLHWGEGMGWGGLMWLLGERGKAVSWDCHMKWTFGSPRHSLKCSICHSSWRFSCFTGKGETTACQNQILLQGQKMWPQLSFLSLPAMPSFQCQKIWTSQIFKHENLVWVHCSSYTLAWMAITCLAFWHQLCRWARAGLPSVPRSVTSWLPSCIVSSVVWTQAKGM